MKSGLKLSREQYGHLIKDIESSLKKHVTGGSFGAPDTVPELHDLQFWVSDPRFEGGGFFSSIGNAFKHVYKSLKSSGVIDKAKDAALKKGRELGGKAIDAAAKRVESEASKRGLDVSKLTAAAAGKAHEHLHEAEGFVSKKIDEGQSELEDKAGVSGSGHPRRGHVSVRVERCTSPRECPGPACTRPREVPCTDRHTFAHRPRTVCPRACRRCLLRTTCSPRRCTELQMVIVIIKMFVYIVLQIAARH